MGNCPTPLRRATRFNEIERARMILDEAGDNAADVINKDHAPDCILGSCSRETGNCFYYAVSRGRTEIVQMMIDKGADVHSTGIFDEPCFNCAVRHNHVQIARMLARAGCDTRTSDDRGNLPIHATGTSYYDTSELIKFLLEEHGKREDVNAQNYEGRTPLHHAVHWNNSAAARTLLGYGADINARTKSGATVLHMTHTADMWDYLVSQGADVTITTNAGHAPKRPTQNKHILTVQTNGEHAQKGETQS